VGDLVELVTGSVVGTAEVYKVTNLSVTLYHVEGSYNATNIRKWSTVALYGIIGSSNMIECISPVDAAYYSPESEYEYLVRMNEGKRNIQMIDKRYADSVTLQLKEHLAE
jgi:hypothetical protein